MSSANDCNLEPHLLTNTWPHSIQFNYVAKATCALPIKEQTLNSVKNVSVLYRSPNPMIRGIWMTKKSESDINHRNWCTVSDNLCGHFVCFVPVSTFSVMHLNAHVQVHWVIMSITARENERRRANPNQTKNAHDNENYASEALETAAPLTNFLR